MEQNAEYSAEADNYRMLVGISMALSNKTLLPPLIDNVNVANTTSRNHHCDINPESQINRALDSTLLELF